MKIGRKLKKKTNRIGPWLNRLEKKEYLEILDRCAKEGISALEANTPVRTGLTAASWSYEIEQTSTHTTIHWKNTNVTRDGQPIAILLQYGHGTGTGGYVVGIDYINPAMKHVFDSISKQVWEVAMKS